MSIDWDKIYKEYPFYKVEGYIVHDFEEAYMLARLLAERRGRKIYIMEKLDPMTPIYVVATVSPKSL